jgi:hypothetical protein
MFRNDEDKEHAIRVLDGYMMNGRKLKVTREEIARFFNV